MENKTRAIPPILKWAGGKRQLLNSILPLIPRHSTYYEPFVGAGAVLFTLQPQKAVIGDANWELINLYRVIQAAPEELVAALEAHQAHHNREYYYAIRALDRDTAAFDALNDIQKAARTVYLNKTCFNGLYRVNASGQFNTPIGNYTNPDIVNADTIRKMHRFLQSSNIRMECGSYQDTLKGIRKGAFVYLDPPYMPLNTSSSFTAYTLDGFGEAEQRALKAQCDELTKKGVKFLLSNSDCDLIHDIYKEYTIEQRPVSRFINASPDKRRGKIDEVLIRNYELDKQPDAQRHASHYAIRHADRRGEIMAESSATLTNMAWKQLFDQYDILNQVNTTGSFRISAAQIKKYREPRLMAKFDHKINLPGIFSENGLSILPVTRGEYVISHFNAYHTFEEPCGGAEKVSMPAGLQSLNPAGIFSETAALNCAAASGILSDFLGEDALVPTVSGRMGSGEFSFEIENIKSKAACKVDVRQSQIEIDGAYEGTRTLALLEVKRDLSRDFLIRQLYYPFRVWQPRVTKQVRPVFLIYSNGIYRLYEYRFENPEHYNSLVLVKQKQYTIADSPISKADIKRIVSEVPIGAEPPIPFPQADKFERVVNLCELLADGELNRNEVTENYAFDARQTNYYTDAAMYLGLLEKGKDGRMPVYRLSDVGKQILNAGYKERQLSFCRCILSHEVFNQTLKRRLNRKTPLKTEDIIKIMKASNLYHVESESTFARRSSTVQGWVAWIMNLIDG